MSTIMINACIKYFDNSIKYPLMFDYFIAATNHLNISDDYSRLIPLF